MNLRIFIYIITDQGIHVVSYTKFLRINILPYLYHITYFFPLLSYTHRVGFEPTTLTTVLLLQEEEVQFEQEPIDTRTISYVIPVSVSVHLGIHKNTYCYNGIDRLRVDIRQNQITCGSQSTFMILGKKVPWCATYNMGIYMPRYKAN